MFIISNADDASIIISKEAPLIKYFTFEVEKLSCLAHEKKNKEFINKQRSSATLYGQETTKIITVYGAICLVLNALSFFFNYLQFE